MKQLFIFDGTKTKNADELIVSIGKCLNAPGWFEPDWNVLWEALTGFVDTNVRFEFRNSAILKERIGSVNFDVLKGQMADLKKFDPNFEYVFSD